MRAVRDHRAVFNRSVATNIRAVARVFPEFVSINYPPIRGTTETPILFATLSPAGHAFITPRKSFKSCRRRPVQP
ncbi:hypothetical protein DY467_07475 [Rhodopseudomonas sp. BR0G17]|nr:hypothetical protein [Rhodopseudomonas sp. BR0G17]